MYSLRELAAEYPRQRDPVIHPLLRFGETANIVAVPSRGKSWLVDGSALSVASGSDWLDTFPCTQGRVLIIDGGNLHEEVIPPPVDRRQNGRLARLPRPYHDPSLAARDTTC